MNEFLKSILGEQSVPQYAAAIFFALVGIFGRLLYHATQRNQVSPRTPITFQWSYLFKDNAMRLFTSNAFSLLLLVLTLRFSNEILHVPLSPFVALAIGFGSDTLSEKFKEASRQIMPYETIATAAQPVDQQEPAKAINPSTPVNEQIPPAPVVEIKSTESTPNNQLR